MRLVVVSEHLVGEDGVSYLRRSACKIDLKDSSLEVALLLQVEKKGGRGRRSKERGRRKRKEKEGKGRKEKKKGGRGRKKREGKRRKRKEGKGEKRKHGRGQKCMCIKN